MYVIPACDFPNLSQVQTSRSYGTQSADSTFDNAVVELKNHERVLARETAGKTLATYMENIIRDAKNEKYRRIRKENAAFQQRIATLPEAIAVLQVGP
jgi:ribosomal protein L17